MTARGDRAALAVTAAAVRKAVTSPGMAALHRRRLARAAVLLASRDADAAGLAPGHAARAVKVARRDADTAFTTAVAAAGSDPRDLHGALGAAQKALNVTATQANPDLRARAHALAAVAITPAAKHRARTRLAAVAGRRPTLHLGRLTGAWAAVYRRRDALLARHAKAVAAAWDACVAELDTADLVRQYRRALRAEGIDA